MASTVSPALLLCCLWALAFVGCSGSTAEPTPVPTATSAPTATPPPTATPIPTVTPTPTPTPTATPSPSPVVTPQQMGLFDYTRAVSLLQVKEFKDAIAAFGLVLRRLPDFALAYNGRGLAYFGEELFEPAVADFSRAIELDPEMGPAYGNRGVVYAELGDTEKAIADLEMALTLLDNVRHAEQRVQIRELLGRLER